MNILYILSKLNIYGGTPKKTLDLITHSNNNCYLYVYEDDFFHFKHLFEKAGGIVINGFYKRNIFKHMNQLLKLVDQNNIKIIHTQFFMGEFLGYMVKRFRPNIKLVVGFVGQFEQSRIKKIINKNTYRRVDAFIYISQYIQNEKIAQYRLLKNKYSKIIYNGTATREDTHESIPHMNSISILNISGLVELKNIDILIDAFDIIIKKKNKNDYFLYVAGNGPEYEKLNDKIISLSLEKHIILLGYQKNIGGLLNNCSIYVHSSYKEGFGIAVAEAMMAEKPIIVANAGALPELIEPDKSGIIVEPFNANAWADAIIRLIEDKEFANDLASAAKKRAEELFSIERYVKNYQDLYDSLMEKR